MLHRRAHKRAVLLPQGALAWGSVAPDGVAVKGGQVPVT